MMNTLNSLFKIHAIYEHTAIILSAESLIMGITLLAVRLSLKQDRAHGKSGLAFLASAMFVLSIINLAEYITDSSSRERYSLAIVVFAASVEMFLLFFAYMSMLNRKFASRRRIATEVGFVLAFTLPALLVSPEHHPMLFSSLFALGSAFYVIKLVLNLRVYQRQMRHTATRMNSYHSNDSRLLLRWVNSTFYLVLAIGGISVVVPMTNYLILVFYNVFLFFAYLYIYLSVITNIDVFDRNMSVIESEEKELQKDSVPSAELSASRVSDFMSSRQKFMDEWMAARGYSITGITANEVAASLSTNRSRLSQYLKNELNTSYYEWIATLRMDDAKKQLTEHPDRSITEIALSVGIEDRDNFRRVFQRIVGMSPSAYRKEYLDAHAR